MDGVRFWVLGPLAATSAGGPVGLGGPRQRAVLALLLARADQVVPVVDLVDGLWGEDPPATAERTLHAYIARLRSLLEPQHRRSASELLVSAHAGYRLRAGPGEVDGLAFELAVAQARRQLSAGDADSAGLALRAALGRWRGRAYADLRGEYPSIEAAAQRLDQLRSDAVVDQVNADLALGRHETMLPYIQNLLTDNPLDERLWAALALAYYRADKQSEALSALSRARTVLADELGIDPGPALRAMQQGILAGDPRLDAPLRPDEASRQVHPGLEGRDEQLVAMRRAWARAGAGHGGVSTVIGAVGMGRTRLLQAFAAEVRAAGGQVIDHYVPDHSDPDHGVASASALTGLGHLMESAVERGCLVLVDDFDRLPAGEQLDLVRLASTPEAQTVLFVVAVSAGEVIPDVGAMLARLDPTGERTISLTPLRPEQVTRVASSYVGPARALEAALAIADRAQGIPARVHREIETWAKTARAAAVAELVRTASADWSGARAGEAELISGLLELAAVDDAAASARAQASHRVRCPYPGLAAYQPADAAFFAGREETVALAVARLAVTSVLTVIGPSGVGKSSLVRAGVVPAITSGALPGSEEWQIEITTPSSHAGLSAAGTHPGRLLVVDQAEELLALDPAGRDSLVRSLRAAVRSGAKLVLAVRADSFPALADDPELAELMDTAQMTVGPMTRSQLTRAVQSPTGRAGGSCDSELATAIVDELVDEAGGLPLLSTTMAQLWERCPDGVLTFDAYQKLGGVRQAVGRLAEDSFGRLDQSQQAAAKALLLRMAGVGANGAVVRTSVALASIKSDEAMQSALAQLAADRLVSVEDGRATPAHEALFTQWPRLARWLSDDAETRAARARLSASTLEWIDGGRLDTDLLRGPRLSAAIDLADQSADTLATDELALIQASRDAAERDHAALLRQADQQRRSNRRLRALLAGAVALLLVVVVIAVTAVRLRNEATAAATVATARSVGALALTTNRLDVALLLAAQSAALDPGVRARSDLLAVTTRAPQATHVMLGDGERILTVAVGGTPPLTAIVDRTGAVTLFDLSTGHRIAATPALSATSNAGVNTAAFSPDGRLLALGGSVPGDPKRGQITFLATADLRQAAPPLATSSPIAALAYGADGTRMAVLTEDGTAQVLATATRTAVAAPIATRGEGAVGVHLDAHGRWLVTDAPSRTWEVATSRALSVPTGYPSAISSTGSVVAVGDGTQVRLLARADGHVLHVLAGHTAQVESATFSPDGTRLITTSDDGSAIGWSVVTGRRLFTLTGHAGRLNSAAFSPDGRTVVTGGFDGRAISWDLEAGSELTTQTGAPATITGLDQGYLAMSTRTHRLLVGAPDGTVVIASAPDGRELGSFPRIQPSGINDAELSPDGRIGSTAGSDRSVRFWNMATGAPLGALPRLRVTTTPTAVAVAPDDRTAAWGDLTGAVTLVSLADGHTLWHRHLAPPTPGDGTSGAVAILSFSPSGTTLAVSVSHVATVLLAADGTGQPRQLRAADDNAIAYSFAPAGDRLLAVDSDGSARLWILGSGGEIDLGSQGEAVTNAAPIGGAFDPAGGTVATWAYDGSVQLWDTVTGAPIGPALANPAAGAVMTAGWMGTETMFTVQADGVIRELAVGSSELMHRACTVAGRTLTRGEWALYLPGTPYAPACRPT